MENKEIVLSVQDLHVNFSTDNGYVQAVRGVSFDLYKGETLCIVGESGSGKSVTSKTVMGILAANGRIASGSIMYEGEDLTKVSEDEFHRIRGHKIGMIFQDPLSSLNPTMRIGKQITEAMLLNSNRIKKMKDEIVAKELVAYKNAVTAYNRELNRGKEAIKFYKSEKKKELERIKNVAKNESDGKIFALKEELGLKEITLEHEYEVFLQGVEKGSDAAKDYKKQLAEQLKAARAEYEAKKAEVLEQAKANESANKAQIEAVKKEYDTKIADARKGNAVNKEELKAKYIPMIAEAKAAYKAKKAEADVEIAKAKEQFKKEFEVEHAEATNNLENAKMKYAEKMAVVKEKYDSARKEIEKEFENLPANSDKKKANAKRQAELAEAKAKFSQDKAALDAELNIAKKAVEGAKNRYQSKIKITKAEAKERALKVMREVGIPFPEKRFKQYPFEFSGGMRQRIVIAIALTADPDILICDEPTTALDVTIQAQILELINRLKAERNISVIFITHDLGVVANMADRVAVMYAGKIVEYGKEEEIFYDPKHPYTWALLSSIPDVDSKERLDAIPGTPPNLIYPPKGDAFALRSKYAMKIDFKKEPPLFKVSETHYAATWLLDPRAPKVEMPAIVKTRIEASLAQNKARNKQAETTEEKPVAKKAAATKAAAPKAKEEKAPKAKAAKKSTAKSSAKKGGK